MSGCRQVLTEVQTIFFGANDARLPNTPGFAQNVPLQQFKENVVKLATHELVAAHNPTIILVTPPPVDERLCLEKDRTVGINVIRRTAENTARYAEAVREVGKTLGLPVLDLWTAFMKEAGWNQGDPLPGSSDIPQNEVLVRLLHDGKYNHHLRVAMQHAEPIVQDYISIQRGTKFCMMHWSS